jgi:TDG/mug DNA glycosylase family protein
MSEKPWKPDRKELEDSVGKTIPDIIARNLDILFCGINPGLYSAAVKHHFARPGNRFWPLLHLSGFTPQVLSPFEDDLLLSMGIGITNLVARATATAAELGREELRDGFRLLEETVKRTTPKVVAILGVGAYRVASGNKKAAIGKQPEKIGDSVLWVLPNPSGINANYQMKELVVLFRRLYNFAKHPL